MTHYLRLSILVSYIRLSIVKIYVAWLIARAPKDCKTNKYVFAIAGENSLMWDAIVVEVAK